MSKRVLAISILMFTSFFVSCSQDNGEQKAMAQAKAALPTVQPVVNVPEFTAPGSSQIGEDKAKLYVKASAALLELGVSWSERIDNANNDEKIQILNAYNVARDQLCARIGLAGFAEYEWLSTVALEDPANKAVFEAAGLKTID